MINIYVKTENIYFYICIIVRENTTSVLLTEVNAKCTLLFLTDNYYKNISACPTMKQLDQAVRLSGKIW